MTSLEGHRSSKEEMGKSVLHKHPALLSHWPCLCWCWDRAAGLVKPACVLSLRSSEIQQCHWQCSKGLAPDGSFYGPSAHCPAGSISLPAANARLDFLGQLLPLSAQYVSFSAVCAATSSSQWALSLGCWGPCWASAKSSVLAGADPWLSSGTPTASDANRPVIVCMPVSFFPWLSCCLIATYFTRSRCTDLTSSVLRVSTTVCTLV